MNRESVEKEKKKGSRTECPELGMLLKTNGLKTREDEAKFRELIETKTREGNFRKQRVWKRSHWVEK